MPRTACGCNMHILCIYFRHAEYLRSGERGDQSAQAWCFPRRRRRLNDPLALTIEDPSSHGEQRFVSIGMNVFGKPRVVVYALRCDDARIISVRKAEPREIRAYEEGL